MKIRTKINLYNFLTVIFAILTVVSLGSFGSEIAYHTVFMNTFLFSLLTYTCVQRENELREILRNHRKMVKHEKAGLTVYKHNGKTTLPAA